MYRHLSLVVLAAACSGALAQPELVRIAHDDASPRVRQQAKFCMAQSYAKLVASPPPIARAK